MLNDEQTDELKTLLANHWPAPSNSQLFTDTRRELIAYVDSLLAQARAEEREACAKECEKIELLIASHCAAAIRARKDGQ